MQIRSSLQVQLAESYFFNEFVNLKIVKKKKKKVYSIHLLVFSKHISLRLMTYKKFCLLFT